jgi:thiol-disulfide isomerase/thioredoxin
MRKLFIALTLLGFVSAVARAADEKGDTKADSNKEKESKSLKVGDAAPQLKVTKWLQGKEVSAFAPDKVYVVEFWATWCGPCIMMMPHLGEIQSEFKDKGVTVIGFTANDANNSADKVAEFVSKRGPKLGYTFAYGADRDTYNAWMTAAGQGGIPCSFVVDQKGKIAYIGHPMFLGEVLPKVVAGTWKAKEGVAELAEAEKELDALFEKLDGPNAEASLKALQEFEKKRPGLAGVPFLLSPKIMLLLKNKKFDEATKLGATALAKAIDQEDTNTLRVVANMNRLPESKGEKAVSDLSLKASDALLKASGDKDLMALVTAAEVNFSAGNTAKAKELGKKAIEAAADQPAGIRKQVEGMVERYDGKKSEKQ